MNEFVEQLIEKHKFVVRVVLTEENVLEVDYAGKQQTQYMLIQDESDEMIGESCIFHVVSLLITTDDDYQELVYLPLYLVRLYLLCHIYAECRMLNLPYNIIQYYRETEDGDVKELLKDLLPFEFSESEKEKEQKLNGAICEVWKDFSKVNGFDIQMKADGLFASFNMLKGLIV